MMPSSFGHAEGLGFIVFAIVMGSLFLILVAAAFGKPWKPKVTLLVLTTLVVLSVAVVFGVWVGGHLFSFLMA